MILYLLLSMMMLNLATGLGFLLNGCPALGFVYIAYGLANLAFTYV